MISNPLQSEVNELLELEREISKRIEEKERKLLENGYTQEEIYLVKEAVEYMSKPLLDEYYPEMRMEL